MRLDKRSYRLGYVAALRRARTELAALHAEQAQEFEAIKRDIEATRRHLNNIAALDRLGEPLACEHESMSVH